MRIECGVLGSVMAIVALASVPLGAIADEHEQRRQFDSHVHGVTNLNVALEGSTLAIEMESPAANIVGFEHRPETAEQEQAIADALAQLEEGNLAFVLSDEAGCELIEADARTSFEEHGEHGHGEHGHGEHSHDKHDHGKPSHAEHHSEGEHSHGEHGEHAGEEVHSEMIAEYRFECASPAQLRTMDVTLFEQFPGIEEIEVQLVSETSQTSVELTPAQSQLSF